MTFNSQVLYSKGDVVITHTMETTPVVTSRFGQVDERVDRVMDMIDFEPDGRFIAAQLPYLYPHATTVIGASIFGADQTLTINSVDGQQRIYKAAAVLKMPQLRFGRKLTMMGPMQFGCIYAVASAPTTANSLYTDSTVSYPGDTGYNASDILTQVYALSWGATSPWDAFGSKDGVTVDFTLQAVQDETESHGVFDYIFQGLVVSAKLEPDGPTPLQVEAAMKRQGSGAALGRSLQGDANDLIITGTGVYFKMTEAALVGFASRFGNTVRRMGPVEFRATRTVTSGVANALFLLDDAAPV